MSSVFFKYHFDNSMGSHFQFEMQENGEVQSIAFHQYSNEVKGKHSHCDIIEIIKPFRVSFPLDMIHKEYLYCKIGKGYGDKYNDKYNFNMWAFTSDVKETLEFDKYNWKITFFVDEMIGKLLFQWIEDLKNDKDTTIYQTFSRNEWKSINLKDTEEYYECEYYNG